MCVCLGLDLVQLCVCVVWVALRPAVCLSRGLPLECISVESSGLCVSLCWGLGASLNVRRLWGCGLRWAGPGDSASGVWVLGSGPVRLAERGYRVCVIVCLCPRRAYK